MTIPDIELKYPVFGSFDPQGLGKAAPYGFCPQPACSPECGLGYSVKPTILTISLQSSYTEGIQDYYIGNRGCCCR